MLSRMIGITITLFRLIGLSRVKLQLGTLEEMRLRGRGMRIPHAAGESCSNIQRLLVNREILIMVA